MQPVLPAWDHNEAIFLTDFACVQAMKHQNSSHTPPVLLILRRPNSCLKIQPRWGQIGEAPFLPFPLLRQSHTPSIINVQRGVAFISISLPNDILRATFVESKRRKNAFNYSLPKILALSNCFSFSLCLHSSPPGLGWMASLSKHYFFWQSYR